MRARQSTKKHRCPLDGALDTEPILHVFPRRVASTHDIVRTRLDVGFSADGTCSTIACSKGFHKHERSCD
jgi:hypothetical protein